MARLDIEIVNRGLAKSRALAQSYIDCGDVMVNAIVADKASKNVSENDEIVIKNKLKYVSRGGLKLEKALIEWLPPLEGGLVWGLNEFICLDIGSSTGGFTDCLLQHGASHVTAIDVGTNQLDASLRENKNITLYENTDIRELKNILENKFDKNRTTYEEGIIKRFDIITIDLSFISLTKVIPCLSVFCFDKKYKKDHSNSTKIIALVKPQFEVGKGNLNKSGIVKDEALYDEVINRIKNCFEENGFRYINDIESPITGGDGNREFLMYLAY